MFRIFLQGCTMICIPPRGGGEGYKGHSEQAWAFRQPGVHPWSVIKPEWATEILNAQQYDYIIDAIDSVTSKLTFLKAAYRRRVPIVNRAPGQEFDHQD